MMILFMFIVSGPRVSRGVRNGAAGATGSCMLSLRLPLLLCSLRLGFPQLLAQIVQKLFHPINPLCSSRLCVFVVITFRADT